VSTLLSPKVSPGLVAVFVSFQDSYLILGEPNETKGMPPEKIMT